MAEAQVRVHTRTYGARGEVEVFLARTDTNPHHLPPALTPTGGSEPRPGGRGVTFSPSVKEVNWRESYYEAEPEEEGSGSDVRRVLVVTSESPQPQRVDLSPPPPSYTPPPAPHLSSSNSDSDSKYCSAPTKVTPPTPSPTMAPVSQPAPAAKTNGRVQEQATSGSDAEMNGEKSPRVLTPIWQRFKLPKLPSPKSPRPKLPPKPQSLSSRSSDTEGSKPSSPGGESGSSAPSSPDTRPRRTPASPRFFPWGSKREKKARPPTGRPTASPPPPPSPQVSSEQVGEATGRQVGVKGEPDPAVSVSPVTSAREDSSAAQSVSDSVTVCPRPSVHPVSIPALVTVPSQCLTAVPSATPRSTDSDVSQESVRSPPASSTSGEDSSDAAQLHSPRSAVCKPPLPPHLQRPSPQVFHKARLQSARRQYFSQERQVSAPERPSPPRDVPHVQVPSAPTTPEMSRVSSASRYKSGFDASKNLKERFEQFSASARAERERLAKSTPDLSVIEASVRRQRPRIDSWSQQQQQQREAGSAAWSSDGEAAGPHRGAPTTRAAVHERYKTRAQRIYARSRSQSAGVLETDLDTGASRELLSPRETDIDDLYRDLQHLLDNLPTLNSAPQSSDKTRAKSLLDLDARGAAMATQLATPARPPDTRAKSMEFLLDDGNKAAVQWLGLSEAGPPENELMKGTERQLSEAELRVRRSLQRLDVPDWMKNATPPQQGFLLRRRDYGSTAGGGGGGWSAYSSKTASMTSLGSSRAHTPNTPTKVVIPTRVATRGVGGLGGVMSPASNSSISPSPSDRSGSLFHYPSSRWSTSRLNSGTTTPTGSVTSSRTTATCGRQPYLGWRSQTSLASLAGSQSSLTSSGSYLTAADRLALGITAYSQRFVKQQQPPAQDKENCAAEANSVAQSDTRNQGEGGGNNGIQLQVPTDVADVHSSIKEVTSAIVHYCNESTPSPRASPRGSPRPEGRAPSPRRLVWVESSFVGSRPITSPETPTSSTHAITPTSQLNGHDLPEGGEVTPRPPQPPGEYLMAW